MGYQLSERPSVSAPGGLPLLVWSCCNCKHVERLSELGTELTVLPAVVRKQEAQRAPLLCGFLRREQRTAVNREFESLDPLIHPGLARRLVFFDAPQQPILLRTPLSFFPLDESMRPSSLLMYMASKRTQRRLYRFCSRPMVWA